MINWTEVLLSLMTLLGSCGWFVAGKKHKQEVEGLKTENQMKKLDLSSEFVNKFRELIIGPLETEVKKLRRRRRLKRCMIVRIGLSARSRIS